jgi:2-polyprenyl-3-methyl-5-hydroxy-6-metoxy-1,4-benzoquinol methylase
MTKLQSDTVREIQPENVRTRFEKDAENFDAIYRLERSPVSRWLNTTFRKGVFDRFEITFREAGDVTGQSILDIGCGSGIYSADFARRGAARVVGIDFSTNMLELARQEAARFGVEDRCEFRLGDFLQAEFDETFDVTIAMGVFDYLREPAPFLKKMVAVTHGKVIASFPGHSLVREPLRRLRYACTDRGFVRFYYHSDVLRAARAAGLQQPRIIRIPSSGGGYMLVGDCSRRAPV